MSGGVTHKELKDALDKQTETIVATLRRSEDKVERKVDKISDRVTYLERRNRWETFFASVVAFFGAVFYNKYGG
jgi:hypothetical protein